MDASCKVDNRGAGRLLTLLSLQSLSRTLITDTRETFGEGFAFSMIKADATVTRGVMSTENFSMAGAGAAALISGSVNLRNETQQLHLVVLPEIDASTAALAARRRQSDHRTRRAARQHGAQGTAVKAFALEYDITGTWSDPMITRRKPHRRQPVGARAMILHARLHPEPCASPPSRWCPPRVSTSNLATAAQLIAEAAATGARLIALPEYFCLMGLQDTDKVAVREPLGHGPIQDFLAAQARRHGVWLVGGTLPLEAPEPDRVLNRRWCSIRKVTRVARYDKVHLFRFTRGAESYDEAVTIAPGARGRHVSS